MPPLLEGAWRYRSFIASSIAGEFRARYARSKLGVAWMVGNPLAQVAIFALVLSAVLSSRLPGVEGPYAYAIFLTAGMLAWALFAEIVGRCLTVFIEAGPVLTKLAFPRICLPLIAIGGAVVNNLLLFAAMVAVFLLLGHPPGVALAWYPVLALLTVALASGLGLVLGVLNVFIRDVGQVVPIALQFLFWLTPIVYVPEIVPEPWRGAFAWNPLTSLVAAYRDVFVAGRAPDPIALAPVALLAAALLALALFMFRRAGPDLPEAL